MIKPVERRLRQENDQEEERNMVKTIGNTLDLCSHGTVASLLHRFDNQSAWRNDSGDFIV